HRLAGHDPDPDLEVEAGVGRVQLLDGVEHLQGGADRPLGGVLVGGGAEHGHDPVADELVDRAAVTLDLPADPHVVGQEPGPHVLGVGVVGGGGEADQVAEDHGDDLALLTGRGRPQGAPAGEAEPGRRRVLLPAPGTDRHARNCTVPAPRPTPNGHVSEPGAYRSRRRFVTGSTESWAAGAVGAAGGGEQVMSAPNFERSPEHPTSTSAGRARRPLGMLVAACLVVAAAAVGTTVALAGEGKDGARESADTAQGVAVLPDGLHHTLLRRAT